MLAKLHIQTFSSFIVRDPRGYSGPEVWLQQNILSSHTIIHSIHLVGVVPAVRCRCYSWWPKKGCSGLLCVTRKLWHALCGQEALEGHALFGQEALENHNH